MPIHLLPPEISNKIAAGEVVERPASAVKELIENSLDAGATEIRVEIREGGRRLLKVIDNGHGIPVAELPLAFQRHATSKINDAGDLAHIATLGFRGEALASIAAVSQITMLAHHQEENIGSKIVIHGGERIALEPAGAPPGTTVIVENLFYNTPARRKFLRRPATEASHINKIVTHYALAFPDCRFRLLNEGRLTFQSHGSGNLQDVISRVYGPAAAKQMIPVGDENSVRNAEQAPLPLVHGYTSLPTLSKSNRSHISIFLNQRWIQDRNLVFAVIQAYHTLLMVGRYPVTILHIRLDPDLVDVNVHPTKAEVRFRDPRVVFQAVQRAVRQAVVESAPIPEINWPERDDPGSRQPGMPIWPRQTPANNDQSTFAFPPAFNREQDAMLSPAANTPRQSSIVEPQPPTQGSTKIPPLRVIGQIAATYIVAEGPDGLYLIDQHAAHERILYEKMMTEREQHDKGISRQQLLAPLTVHMGERYAGILAEHLADLGRVGFAIEPFGGDTFIIRAVPALLSNMEPQHLLEEVLEGLAHNENKVTSTAEGRMVTTICKRAAIKGGQILSVKEMRTLIRQLEETKSPRTCPHGRPTMLHLSADQLASRFGRIQ